MNSGRARNPIKDRSHIDATLLECQKPRSNHMLITKAIKREVNDSLDHDSDPFPCINRTRRSFVPWHSNGLPMPVTDRGDVI